MISVITTLIRIVPDTVTTLPIRYPVIPFGVALARSSVPSSRSIVKMPPSVAIPLKPTFMPIMLASMAVPSEKRVPGRAAPGERTPDQLSTDIEHPPPVYWPCNER